MREEPIFEAALYDDGYLHMKGICNIADLMTSLTVITNGIYDIEELSDFERKLFVKFVKEELPRLAFMTERELEENLEKDGGEEREMIAKLFSAACALEGKEVRHEEDVNS